MCCKESSRPFYYSIGLRRYNRVLLRLRAEWLAFEPYYHNGAYNRNGREWR